MIATLYGQYSDLLCFSMIFPRFVEIINGEKNTSQAELYWFLFIFNLLHALYLIKINLNQIWTCVFYCVFYHMISSLSVYLTYSGKDFIPFYLGNKGCFFLVIKEIKRTDWIQH